MKFLIILFCGLLAAVMANFNPILKESNDIFTSKFLGEIVKEKPNQNLIFSAFSLLPPLAQLAIASVGETKSEILRTIHVSNDNEINEAFSGLSNQLRAVKGVDLKMANRLYISYNSAVNPDFDLLSRNLFNSEVEKANFGQSRETAAKINGWVEDQTNHKIKDLIDPNQIDTDTRAILVNAIYFKGTWATPFNKEITREGDFHVSKDKTVKVQYMRKSADFMYGESKALDAKLIELPYSGREASFLIILPNKIDGLNELQEKLKDHETMAKAVDGMSSYEVDLVLPKFKIETTINLKELLKKMGIDQLFSSQKARLDNLLYNETNLHISSAVQKAFIEINEEGAEAAAANEFGVSYLSAFISEKREFKADHPFVFYLKKEDNTLFCGMYHS